MKKTNIQTISIAIFILIIMGIIGYIVYKQQNPTGNLTYTNNEYGIQFSYPAEYELQESTVSTNGINEGTMVTITDKNIALPENGEGPTAITIGMYKGAPTPAGGRTTAETWIASSPYSNFKLSKLLAPGQTLINDKNAYLYTWDGLYQGTSVATEHNGNIIMFSVTYDGETDLEKREAFTDIMASVVFIDNQTATSTPSGVINNVPKKTTVTGAYECAPHKNPEEPHTAECVFGIKANNGNHYILDMTAIRPELLNLAMDTNIEVTGLLVPIEQISTDRWQSYNVQGIMKVEQFKKL